MKKVVFSVTKLGRTEQKFSGIGYVTDEDLITACIGKNGKPYIRVFEDCLKDCFPVKDDEYNGEYYEIREVEVTTKYGSKETKEIEVYYSIWFKFVR